MSACGLAAGAEEVFQTLTEEVKKRNLPVEITKSGCAGMCYAEPMVEIKMEGLPTVIYGKVNSEVALEIVERHIMSKTLLNDHIFEVRG
jgi:(2Fe-2S) ferredoxin